MELVKEMILLNQSYQTKEEAIRACGELLVMGECVDRDYVETMIERNQLVSTYMGNFIAIPHGTDAAKKYVKKTGISVVQVPQGIAFGKGENDQLAMVLFGIAGRENEHLDLLQKIALFCSDVENVAKLVSAQSPEEVIGYLEGVE